MKKIINIIIIVTFASILFFPFLSLMPVTRAQTLPTLSVNPPSVTANSLSDTFELQYKISGVTNLWGWSANVTWDTQYLALETAPVEGDFFDQSQHTTSFMTTYSQTSGNFKGPLSDIGFDSGAQSGDGTLAKFTFRVLKPVVSTTITFNATALYTNQTVGEYPQYIVPINPFPATTYAYATVSYIPSDGVPVADAGSNQTVNQHTSVVLNASKSIPQTSDGTYTWTFFDNESRTLTGMIAEYKFDWPGTFPVTLTMTNSKGTSTALIEIVVKSTTPPIPVITITGYTSGQSLPVNTRVVFYSNESYDPYKLSITSHQWDFGDSSPKSQEPNVSHIYASSGTYTVTLNIKNSAGLPATATKTIIIGDGSGSTATPNPSADDSQTTSTNTPSPSTTTTQTDPTQTPQTSSLNIPPTILYSLIFVTAFALAGSAFWLRRNS